MTGQQLKNSILQEAIQGRLVPNVLEPGEKTGTELLQDILAERQNKENTERGRKSKRNTLSTIEEEPWELPEEWCWCLLPNVATIEYGFPFDSTKFNSTGQGTPLIRIRDVVPGYTKTYTTESASKEYLVRKGDMLTGMDGNFNVNFWDSDDAYLNQRVCRITANKQIIEQRYLYYYLPIAFKEIEEGVSFVTVKHLSDKHLKALAIPLPPRSVQRKIVEILDRVVPQIEAFDKAAEELETLNKILPDKLRKSVLQEAIHGNLVPNDIPEGEATGAELLQQILKERQDRENKEKGKNAKKLTLSAIEEEPWELPEGWCWCKLKDIIDFSSSGTTKNGAIANDSWILDLEDIEKETGRLICKKRFGDVKSKSDKRAFKTGNVLYSKLRPYLNKCIIANEDGYCTTEILAFDFGPIYNRYAQSFLMSPYFVDRVNQGSAGVKMPRVNNVEANDTCFPIPPLSIQHRIVKKIEEVFSAIDKLQA